MGQPRVHDLQAAFRDARRRWGGNGSGSTPAKTSTLGPAVAALIKQSEIHTVIDLGCGDLGWFAPVAYELGEGYLGVDVVSEVIDGNQRAHGKLRFQRISGPADVLHEVDLVVCRDVLAHLPNALALATLQQIARAAPLLLATSHPRSRGNSDIPRPGGARPVNLQAHPFDLGAPLQLIPDADHKVMGLWPIRERMA